MSTLFSFFPNTCIGKNHAHIHGIFHVSVCIHISLQLSVIEAITLNILIYQHVFYKNKTKKTNVNVAYILISLRARVTQ